MNKILIILSFLFLTVMNAQENSIIGTWNTITVSNDMFQMNEKHNKKLKKRAYVQYAISISGVEVYITRIFDFCSFRYIYKDQL